ncbi:MAG TPA: ABC transporter permease, partial [bacterium]|nr:ABC transporter permease [bacterium]
MPFSVFIAFKYLLDEKRQTLFIMSACAIGVAVMVFLYGLISGLQRSLVDRTLGSQAHIILNANKEKPRPLAESGNDTAVMARVERGFDRPQMISDWPRRIEAVAASSGIVAVAPRLTGAALLRRGDVTRPVGVSGIEPDSFTTIIPLAKSVVAGRYDLVGDEIFVGKDLADDLGVTVGDRVALQTRGGAVNFLISAVFDLGNRSVNENQVFVSLRQAQALLGAPGDINQIDTRVGEIFEAEKIARRLEKETGIETISWMEQNSQLLIALRSQSSSSYLIQFFVMVAVALGIASVLVVSVVQKRAEIGILRAFGTKRSVVTRIFLIQGAVVGLLGSTVGCFIGTGLAMFFRDSAKNPDGTPRFPISYELSE